MLLANGSRKHFGEVRSWFRLPTGLLASLDARSSGGGKQGSPAPLLLSASLSPQWKHLLAGGSDPTGGAKLGRSAGFCPCLCAGSHSPRTLQPHAVEGPDPRQLPSRCQEANLAHRAHIIVVDARRRRNSLCVESR